MGNTHSEALVSRERELPLQCVEVPGKEGEEDKAGRKEVVPRGSSAQSAGPEPGPGPGPEAQGRENEGKAGPGAGARQPPPVGPSAAGVKAKLGPGKKRKIAKARKWASSQVASQEPVMAVERLRPIVMAELIRVQTARPGLPAPGGGGCQLPKEGGQEKQPRPNGGEAPGLDVPHPHGHELGPGPGLKHRGQGEPAGAILSHPGRHPAPGKAGKRAQLPWATQQPQGEAGAVRGAGGQATVKANGNGKESPCKLIKLSIIRPPAPATGACKGQGTEQQAEGPRAPRQEGETVATSDTRPGQACPLDARPGKSVPEPAVEAAPRHGRLKAHSFLSKRGAHVEPAMGLPPRPAPPPDLPPLSPNHQASSPVAISYAQALKQAPEPRNPGQPRPTQREVEAARPETKEAAEARLPHDPTSAASKKKLPFYEQLIASLKSQAQRQKGVRPQRSAPAQEGVCLCGPGKAETETEAEEEARPVAPATHEPLLLPSPGPPSDPGPAPFPQPPSRPTFQFEGRVCPEQGGGEVPAWFQAPCPLGPEKQAQACRGVSLVAPTMPASPPVGPATLDWLRPEPGAPASPPCPLEPLPVWPLAQGQAQVQIQAQMGSPTHPQCPQPAAQVPPHPQRPSGIEQPPQALALPQPTGQAETELPTRQRPSPEPAPPTSKTQLQAETKTTPKPPAPARPRAGGARPQRQEQLAVPKAPSLPAATKARPQPQTRGRKVQPQRPEPPTATPEAEADAEATLEGKAEARPTGRWAAFQVDRTCTRTCRCRHRLVHRPSHLPRNVEAWNEWVREPFCEIPWVRTAVLAGSLVAGTKFCIDHFKANNILN